MQPAWPADKVERWPIARLIPYARNARTHTAEQIKQIAASMREWGWTMPVLADEQGGIIAGHCRVSAAEVNGYAEVPVMVAEGWTEAKKRAYVLADNKLALNAGWDDEILAGELADLKAADFDLEMLGFSRQELERLWGGPQEGEDEIPEPGPAVTERGDVWELGAHRLVCGDARDGQDVARLCNGAAVNLVFTSPPYASQREYDESSGFRPIPPDKYVNWFEPIATNIRKVLAADGSYFLNIKPSCEGLDTELYVFDLVLAHVRSWGWHFATEFCWERNGVPKSVTQRFKNQFEPIYQFALNRWKMRPDEVRHMSENVPTAGGPGSGETSWANQQGGKGARSVSGSFGAAKKRRNGTKQLMSDMQGQNVAPGEYVAPGLAYPGNRLPTFCATHEATGHTAAFPVGLATFFIQAFTDAKDTVYDPFAGSGSTLISAERNARTGLALEISPTYCDVIVKRWENFTGKTGVRHGA